MSFVENKANVCALISGAMALVLIVMVLAYDKLGATWSWTDFPVIIIGLVLTIVVVYIFSRFLWFSDPREPVSTRILATLVIGFVVSAFAGVYFTEPNRTIAEIAQPEYYGQSSYNYGYDYRYTRAGDWFYGVGGDQWFSSSDSDSHSSSSSHSSSKSSSKGSGEVIIFLFLLALVVILVAGAFVLPHFWVVTLMVLLGVSIQLWLRELRLQEYHSYHPYSWPKNY